MRRHGRGERAAWLAGGPIRAAVPAEPEIPAEWRRLLERLDRLERERAGSKGD